MHYIYHGEGMLEATRSCSLAGLCFCLLAISAATLTSSTIFCCTFLPLLLLGCSLSARFLFPSKTKPVAGKRYKKRGRLKTDTVTNNSLGASLIEGLAHDITDAFASSQHSWIANGSAALFIALVVGLAVAEMTVTALLPTTRIVES